MDLIKECLTILELKKDLAICVSNNMLVIEYNKNKFELQLNDTNHLIADPNDYLSSHLVRILTYNNLDTISESNIFDFLMFLNDNLIDVFKYCTLCNTKIYNLGKPNVCAKCFDKSTEYIIDNTVTDCYNDDKVVFNVLILSAYACLKHAKCDLIFKPLPNKYTDVNELKKVLKYDIGTFGSLIDRIQDSPSDYCLSQTIGQSEYEFLKFVIKTNTSVLKSDLLFSDKKNIFDQKKISNIMTSDDILTLAVEHDSKVEEKFSTIDPQYLFHGSTIANWYSILRNGLHNNSGTALMANGSAYGSGIYLSDTLTVSFNYGADRYAGSHIYVIGVVQVLKPKQDYKKVEGIYVVANGSDTMLKYVIVTKNSKRLGDITEYFMKKRISEINSSHASVMMVQKKRLLHDLEKMTKIAKKNNWKFIEHSDSHWQLDFDNGSLSVRIPIDYPIKPPFIWLNSLRHKIVHDMILSNGAIFINEFILSEWRPNKKIYVHIKKFILTIVSFNKSDNVKHTVYDEKLAYEEYCQVIKTI